MCRRLDNKDTVIDYMVKSIAGRLRDDQTCETQIVELSHASVMLNPWSLQDE